MLNSPSSDTAIERQLLRAYVPTRARAAIDALFALDDALASVCRTTTEPVLGQMRLAWWHQSLEKLDRAPPPAEPVLRMAAAALLPCGISGAQLAGQVTGWDVLIEEPDLSDDALSRYADGRGRSWFTAAALALGGPVDDLLAQAGAGWALADLSGHLSDPVRAAAARRLAAERLNGAFRQPWPTRVRPLGLMALGARLDAVGGPPVGSPRRLGRYILHRLTGR